MVLKDRNERNNVLLAAKKLKQSSNYSEIFLCPDLTEAQRIQFTELVKIRDIKNRNMMEDMKEIKIY